MHIKLLTGIFVILNLVATYAAPKPKPIVLNASIPIEKTAEIYFDSDVSPSKYNGAPLMNGIYYIVPAGKSKIICNITGNYIANDKQFSFNFEAGQRYLVVFGISGGYWGVYIYENPKKKQVGTRNDKKTFVRFE